jgi:hypothetical protein
MKTGLSCVTASIDRRVFRVGTIAGTRTLRAGAQALHMREGVRRSGWRRSVRVREPRSRRPRSRCARGWINGSRADDNQRIMTSDSSSEKPIIMQLSADPSDFSFAGPGHRRKPSAWRRITFTYSFTVLAGLIEGGCVAKEAALPHHFFEVTIAESITQIPAHAEKDDLGLIESPLERIGFRQISPR